MCSNSNIILVGEYPKNVSFVSVFRNFPLLSPNCSNMKMNPEGWPKVKLMSHNYYLNIQDLNTFNISDGFILYGKIVSK